MTFRNVEQLEQQKTAAANAAEQAKLALSAAEHDLTQSLTQAATTFQSAASALTQAASALRSIPGVFDVDAFTDALSAVALRVANALNLGKYRREAIQQGDQSAALARQQSIAGAEPDLAAIKSQIAPLAAALLDAAAPDLPIGVESAQVLDRKQDYCRILDKASNTAMQAGLLVAQASNEQDSLGLAVLLGTPMKFAWDAYGVKRQTLLRQYVDSVFAAQTTKMSQKYLVSGFSPEAALAKAAKEVPYLMDSPLGGSPSASRR